MAFKHDKNNSFVIFIFDLKLCLVHAYNHYVYYIISCLIIWLLYVLLLLYWQPSTMASLYACKEQINDDNFCQHTLLWCFFNRNCTIEGWEQ